MLETQLAMTKQQLEDNKKVTENLMIAMEKDSKKVQEAIPEQKKLLETNKTLSEAVERMEKKQQEQESKIVRLKRFQKMIKCSHSLQCKYCAKFYHSEVFSAHLAVCNKDSSFQFMTGAYSKFPINITITQTLIKEESENKPFTEYVIQVNFNNKTWNVSRKYRMFCELDEKLKKEYPNVRFPDSSAHFASKSMAEIMQPRKGTFIEERRKTLQQYLIDLSFIPLIKESITFKQFVGISEHFPDEIENLVSKAFENIGNLKESDLTTE